jgi:hypothetical protein
MNDPASWAAWLQAEWTAIAAAPFSFSGAVIVVGLGVWMGAKAWYRRLIQIEKGQTKLVQAELEIERRQKEGLRQALRDLKPQAPVLALEVAYGDPEIREVVMSLARGETISTPVNPTAPVMRSIPGGEINKTAVVLYTSANGLSQTTSVQPGGVAVSSSTTLGVQVADYLKQPSSASLTLRSEPPSVTIHTEGRKPHEPIS